MVRFEYSKHKPTHSLNDFEFLHDPNDKNSKLGTGSFATVKLAQDKKSGKLYALKMIDTSHSRFSKTDLENLKLEIDIHKGLDHPNIIKFHGYIQHDNFIYLVLDYAENGNLYTYLHRKKILTEKEIFRFFHQTCLAIHYLHQNNIVHRDIKPENLLLDKDLNIKICDFGWSAYEIRQERQTFCGTYEYMAPEIVHKKSYDYRVDIWAVGILLYELIHNKAPYKGRSLHEIKNSLNQGEISFNSNMSQDVKGLIKSILKEKPSKRVSMVQILTDRWVNDHLAREEDFRRSVYLESINFADHQKGEEAREKHEEDNEDLDSSPLSFIAKAIQQIFKTEETVLRKVESNILPQDTGISKKSILLQKSKSTNEKYDKLLNEPNKTPKKKRKIFEGATLTPRFQDKLNKIIKNIRSKRNSEISPRHENSSTSTSNSTLEINVTQKTSAVPEKSSQSPLFQIEPDKVAIQNDSIKEGNQESKLIDESIKVSLRNISNFNNVTKKIEEKEIIRSEFKFRAPSSALLPKNQKGSQENSRKKIFDGIDYLKKKNLESQKNEWKMVGNNDSGKHVSLSSWSHRRNNKENIDNLSIGARNI